MTAENKAQHWRDLGVKDKAALVTACISFALGFLIAFIGLFIDPKGEIDGSVITTFGTALLYAAGIFGVAMYFKTNNAELFNQMLDKIDHHIERKIREHDEAGE